VLGEVHPHHILCIRQLSEWPLLQLLGGTARGPTGAKKAYLERPGGSNSPHLFVRICTHEGEMEENLAPGSDHPHQGGTGPVLGRYQSLTRSTANKNDN